MKEFFSNISFSLASAAGLIIIGAVVWFFMARSKQKGLLWIPASLLVLAGTIMWISPLLTKSTVGGADKSQCILCSRYGADHPEYCKSVTAEICAAAGESIPRSYIEAADALDSTTTIDSAVDSGGGRVLSEGVDSLPHPSEPEVVWHLRQDAIEVWVETQVVLRPGHWNPNASTGLFPEEVKCAVVDTDRGPIKANEIWTWTCEYVGENLVGVLPYTFTSNGWFARDSGSWDLSTGGGDVMGTGDWNLCPQCWESVVPPTPVVNAPPPLLQEEQTQAQPHGQQEVATPTSLALAGCPSKFAPTGMWPAGQRHSNGYMYCLEGSWITAKEFLDATGVTPDQVQK